MILVKGVGLKKRILVLLYLVVTFTNCYSQELIPFSYMGKIGYLDQKLEVILSPQYDYGSNFVDGYAIVEKRSKYHVIDYRGDILYSSNARDLNHIGDSLFVEQNGLYKIIDIDSKRIIANNLQSVQWDGDGNTSIIAAVYYDSDIRSSYINNKGETLFDNMLFNRAYSFNQGVATVLTDDWLFAILDIKGNIIYGDYRRLGKVFSEGLSPAQTMDLRTGYIDTNGQFVFEIPLVVSNEMGYENTPFENGRAIINCLGDEQYFIIIDNEGNYLSDKIRADNSYGFNEGMSVIHKYSYANDEHIYGYVNTQGEIVYNYQFSKAKDFYNGYARVILQGKEAIIDKVGNIYYSSDLIKESN